MTNMPIMEIRHALDADSPLEMLLLSIALIGASIGAWLFLFVDL